MTQRQGTGGRSQGSVPPPTRTTKEETGAGVRVQRSVPRIARMAGMVIGAGIALVLAPIAASAETIKLTAEEAAARAVEVSHATAAAAARVEATRETVKAADAAALPSLSAGAAVARLSSVPEFELPFTLPGQQPIVLLPDITTTYGTSLKLQQALYTGGSVTARREAARHDAEASAAAQNQTAADVRLSAQVSYWEAVRTAAAVDLAHSQEDRANRLLSDTRALFDAGMAVRADVAAAEERSASARVQVIASETAAANALTQLRSLLHVDSPTRIELADSLAGPLPLAPGALDGLQRKALAGRPELAASAAQLSALRSREGLARAEARPTLGAIAEWDYNRPNSRYFPQTDQLKQSWSVALAASWTLFDGGRARADTATSRFTQRAASEDRDELTRRILVDVEADRRNLESALAAVVAADAARAAAVEREKAARERHAAGLAPIVDTLDAQAQLAGAEQQQVNARAAAWIAAAVLERSVGR